MNRRPLAAALVAALTLPVAACDTEEAAEAAPEAAPDLRTPVAPVAPAWVAPTPAEEERQALAERVEVVSASVSAAPAEQPATAALERATAAVQAAAEAVEAVGEAARSAEAAFEAMTAPVVLPEAAVPAPVEAALDEAAAAVETAEGEAQAAVAEAEAALAARLAAEEAQRQAEEAARAAEEARLAEEARRAWSLAAQASLDGWGNGQAPVEALVGLSWDPGEHLRADAAAALEALNAEYRAAFGVDLTINDAYRSYDRQVYFRQLYGRGAARPGTSRHGLGRAVDLGGGVQAFGTAQHEWMRANAERFGWYKPAWSEPGGSLPEAWHWEYQNPDNPGHDPRTL